MVSGGNTNRQSPGNAKEIRAEQTRQIVELRRQNKTFDVISQELGIPKGTVYKRYNDACKNIPVMAMEAHRAEMLEQLDKAEQLCLTVLDEMSLKVSANGHVVMHEGMPLRDRTAALDAAKTLARLQERKAKLLGADAQQKTSPQVNVTYTVSGVNLENLK